MPTSLNPALTIAGPAAIVWKGKALYSKGDIAVNIKEEYLDLESSAYGVVAKAVKSTVLEVQLTPIGTIDCLAELIPAHIRAALPGTLVHHARDVGAVSTVTGVVTSTAHGFRDLAMVRLDSFGAVHTGWSKTTLYYLHALSADSYTLHTTLAAAEAGTDPVIPSALSTARNRIIEQETLTIWSLNESHGYVFCNAAVTGIPTLTASSTATVFDAVTFTCYRRFGADPAADAEAFYSEITAAPDVDFSFDPDDIVLGASTAAWGAAAPWSALALNEAGAKTAIAVNTTPVLDGVAGIVSHRVDGVTATTTLRAKNISEREVFAARVLQGTGAGLGRRLAGNTLTITTDEYTLALNNAVLSESPVGFDGKEDRVRDLQFSATRKFTAGTIAPLFAITLAP